MVKVLWGSAPRIVRNTIVGIICILTFYFKKSSTYKSDVEFKRSENELSSVEKVDLLPPVEDKNKQVFIPEMYLDSKPNISPHDFRYIIVPEHDDSCGVSYRKNADTLYDNRSLTGHITTKENHTIIRPLLVLFLVHSKAIHFEHRNIIRATWGSIGKRLSKVIFLLGNPQNESMQFLLENENELYKDILQEDFYETYRNITLKAIMGLKWASCYCPRAAFVTKVDDDMYVGVKQILSNIIKGAIPRRKLLLCKPVINGVVQRSGKYAVPEQLYNASTWPPFCFGGCWIASSDVIKKLYEISLMTSPIYLDDVFVTGILRTKIGQKLHRVVNNQLFCHARGNPKLVELWWENKTNQTNLWKGMAHREKITDCFH